MAKKLLETLHETAKGLHKAGVIETKIMCYIPFHLIRTVFQTLVPWTSRS